MATMATTTTTTTTTMTTMTMTVMMMTVLPWRNERVDACMRPPSSPSTRVRSGLMLCIGLAVLTMICLPARIGAAASADEPRFVIETIDVEGLSRASGAIVISESMLVPGREYGEEELRQAIYRINRLPFVVQARFSLQRGSARGLYGLVIEVEETERFFLGLDESLTLRETTSRFSTDRFSFGDQSQLDAGARLFVGARGVLYGSVTESLTGLLSDRLGSGESVDVLTLGYTQYGLLDRPLSLSVVGTWEPGSETVGYFFGLGLQLPQSRSLRLELGGSDSENGWACVDAEGRLVESCTGRSRYRSATLEWRWDTTDDVVLPSQGRLIRGVLTYASDEWDLSQEGFGLVREQTTRSRGATAEATWYRPVGLGRTLAATLRTGLLSGTSAIDDRQESPWYPRFGDSSYELYGASVRVAWLDDIWRVGPGSATRDLRWESWVEAGLSGSTGDRSSTISYRAGTGLVFRNRWGVLRAGISYQGQGGGE